MNDLSNPLLNIIQTLCQQLQQQQLTVATAESCTGGGLAYFLTHFAGSSAWFERGFVTYSNEAKMAMLGVPKNTLATYGAVSEETALAMAAGALEHSAADLSVAITGIAGPDGGTSAKPVGTVWIAWCKRHQQPIAQLHQLNGDREHIRTAAMIAAVKGLLAI